MVVLVPVRPVNRTRLFSCGALILQAIIGSGHARLGHNYPLNSGYLKQIIYLCLQPIINLLLRVCTGEIYQGMCPGMDTPLMSLFFTSVQVMLASNELLSPSTAIALYCYHGSPCWCHSDMYFPGYRVSHTHITRDVCFPSVIYVSLYDLNIFMSITNISMYNYMNAVYLAKLTYEISLSPVHHSKISPSKISHYAYMLTCYFERFWWTFNMLNFSNSVLLLAAWLSNYWLKVRSMKKS